MEYIIGAIAVMLPIAIYLCFELLKSKAQSKAIQKELDESRRLRRDVVEKVIVPTVKDTGARREKIKNINQQEVEGKAFRDLLARASKQRDQDKYDVWYGDKSQCPPKSGDCPMMFYAILAGQSATCSACNKIIRSSSPMF